jgi:D-3-phosphoglycerate dehydrogenase
MANVVATHHTAGVSHDARYNIAKVAAEQIELLAVGNRPPRLVNQEVWPIYQKRFKQALL